MLNNDFCDLYQLLSLDMSRRRTELAIAFVLIPLCLYVCNNIVIAIKDLLFSIQNSQIEGTVLWPCYVITPTYKLPLMK